MALLALAGCGASDEPAPLRRLPPASRCDASRCDAPEGGPPNDAAAPEGGAVPPPEAGVGAPDGASRPACCDPFVLRLARLEEHWPLLLAGHESRSFSSYDRTGGNSDGFVGTHSFLYRTESGEHVLFDAYGPGVLNTLWFTGADEGGANNELGLVRFYLDDEATPRVELPWQELFRGDRSPFLAPLVANNAVSTGGYVSWVPVPFARRLVVTTEKRPSFYQAHYETLPPDAVVESFRPETDVEPALARFAAVLGGETTSDVVEIALDATLDGPGVIDVLRFTPAGEPADDELRAARVRITWDGAAAPQVDAPLAAFFGSGLGAADVRSLPLSIRAGVFESRFVMPFWERAHLEIEGTFGKLEIRARDSAPARGAAGHFHATYAEDHPTTPGAHFQWLDLQGAGTLAGTSLTVEPATPTTKKWWEGDLHSAANGLRTPALEGTGHEDDHLGGWSNTFLSGPFTLPLHGEPRSDLIDTNGQYNANATMYRFYPGIRFASALRHATEHGDRDGVTAGYSGVAWYYLDPDGPRLVESDSLDVSDAASRAAHEYTAADEAELETVTSRFDGPWNEGELSRLVSHHAGPASFRLAVPPGNAGCHLRRVFDQSSGRQGARVFIDSEPVATFYAAEANASRRFAERDLFLPGRYTSGKRSLAVTVVPLPGGPPWSVAEYRLLCLDR